MNLLNLGIRAMENGILPDALTRVAIRRLCRQRLIQSQNTAEDAALAITCERAQIKNGQRILELGCGWGSLTLWMGQHFFTGGIMPSVQLLGQFSADLNIFEQHSWNGQHYQRTAEQWLANMDTNRETVLDIMQAVYGDSAARQWFNRWRTFFLAVSELFGYQHGEQWFVSHYLLEHRSQNPTRSSADPTGLPMHQPSSR